MFGKLKLGAAALSVGLFTAACGGGGPGSGSAGTIEYWLWDSGQQPGYQKCADAFQQQNPGLRIHISQYGWDDYWSKLTAGFIADTAPDVFTDHLSKYAQFVDLEVLRPLDDLAATADINDADYQEGLAALWKGQDGKRYGAPKDWDTIAMFYNGAAVKAAGIDPAALQELTWNPQDGGTFEKTIAHLTIDNNGVRGDEPGFDKNNVKTYGFGSDGAGGGGWGQTQWSAFTGSAGWQALDKNPWGTKFNLDQPALQDTLAWYFGLADKGYMPSFAEIGGNNPVGPDKQIQSGIAAIHLHRPHRRRRREARHRPRAHPDRPVRQTGVDVQRPGRLDHHTVPATRGSREVGQVPLRRGVPEHHRPVRRGLPRPAQGHRAGSRLQQGRAEPGRHTLHRPGEGEDHVPVPGDDQRRGHHRADAAATRLGLHRQRPGQLADRPQQTAQQPLRGGAVNASTGTGRLLIVITMQQRHASTTTPVNPGGRC
jgi:hypothetical protein